MIWEQSEQQMKEAKSFSLKQFGKNQWLVLVLLGLLLVIIAMPTGRTLGSASSPDVLVANPDATEEIVASDLEIRLEKLLEQVEGVGQVQVMVYPENERGSFTSLDNFEGGAIRGALIVAEGADNPVTVQKIQEAVMALFQVDAHKIKVMKMK